MTVDERIDKLTTNLEKTEVLMAQVLDSIKRLERIAGVLLLNDEDLDRRLTELEGRAKRKPQ